jgi:hypothetical protein
MDEDYYFSSNTVIQQPAAGFNTGCTASDANQTKIDEMSKLIHELQNQSAVVLLHHDFNS